MAFLCSGVLLPASDVPKGLEAVPLDANLAFIHSPAQDAGSEGGLDHVQWAEGIARSVRDGVRLVYVEAEFFGGTGNQAAIGWDGGTPAFGPLRTQMPQEDREGFEVVANQDLMAINEALRWMGITRTEVRDEFDVVGVGRCALKK